MSEETELLSELVLHADRFCCRIEAAMNDSAPNPEEEQLRLKLGECRNLIVRLQNVFIEDKLEIENPSVRAEFRYLILGLLWVSFHARKTIDRKLFRMVVLIQASFTHLLIMRP